MSGVTGTEYSRKVVSWCPTCVEAVSEATWAPVHTDQTGHPTHRRTSLVETFAAEDEQP